MAHLLLWTLAASIPAFVPADETSPSGPVWVTMLGSAIIVIIGLWWAYRANGGDDGRDFAGRLLALAWVLGLRLMLFSIAVIFAIFIVAFAIAMAAQESSENGELSGTVVEWVASSAMLLYSVVFFWRLAHHLRDLRVTAPTSA